MSLKLKTTHGIIWRFSQEILTKGISVLVTIILARLLIPEDFGLMSMIAIFIALGTSLMNSGLREALIRQVNTTQVDLSTAFYMNVALGLGSYLVLYFLAPFIAQFYNETQLIKLIRVISLIIIINSFQIVQLVTLTKELNFKVQLKASIPASLVSGCVAIYLAYFDWGVWALVSQALISSVINTVMLWYFQRWIPSLVFQWSSAKELYSFGYKLFLSGFLNTTFENVYVTIIAKLFNAKIAGYYFFADKIKTLIINQFVYTIQSVTYPALSAVQNDSARLKRGYQTIIILMTMVISPVLLTTAALAEPIFKILLPNNWLPAVPYFQLLCLSALMLPLHSLNLNVLKVKGRSDLFLYLDLLKKIIISLVLLFTYKYGVYAIIYGQIITSIINYFPNSYFSKELINYSLAEQLQDFLPTLLISIISAGVVYILLNLVEWQPIVALTIFIPLVLIIFIFLNIIFNKNSFNLTSKYILTFIKHKL